MLLLVSVGFPQGDLPRFGGRTSVVSVFRHFLLASSDSLRSDFSVFLKEGGYKLEENCVTTPLIVQFFSMGLQASAELFVQ
jgi:hypothetical protein